MGNNIDGATTIWATDAKEVGVENPAEETIRHQNQLDKHLGNFPRQSSSRSGAGDV
jgi:hypothetical protein